ncbi:MAG: lysoplasmalogenase [Bacteroidales bacterium]|nr:lysoplasmalogenase [Bacteroidales bacterium]
MAIPVLVYVSVILMMVWRAIAQRKIDKYAIYAVIGSLFFVFSDITIAVNKFYISIPNAQWIIMITYWISQCMIFYSAYKVASK